MFDRKVHKIGIVSSLSILEMGWDEVYIAAAAAAAAVHD